MGWGWVMSGRALGGELRGGKLGFQGCKGLPVKAAQSVLALESPQIGLHHVQRAGLCGFGNHGGAALGGKS